MQTVNKLIYTNIRRDVRSNGVAYTLQQLHVMYHPMIKSIWDNQETDLLQLRQMWAKRPDGDTNKTIIRCTASIR